MAIEREAQFPQRGYADGIHRVRKAAARRLLRQRVARPRGQISAAAAARATVIDRNAPTSIDVPPERHCCSVTKRVTANTPISPTAPART